MKLRELYSHALQRPHLRRAIRSLRRLEEQRPSPEARLEIPFVFRGAGFFRHIRAMQSRSEIRALYREVLSRQPRVVVEIGTCHGGTLYLWCQAAHPEATVISIDLPEGEFGGGYQACRAALYQAFAGPQQKLHLLRANSSSAETQAQVGQLLGERPIDFLFIDGDHTYAGVRRDFEVYSRRVAEGGLIAFHDIVPRPDDPKIEVWRFWNELKLQHATQEWLDTTGTDRRIGIGALTWRR